MDLSRMLRQTVTVHTVTQDGPPDDFGDPTEQSTTATHKGYAWQASTDEDTAGGQVERERWKLAIATTAEGLSAGDRVTVAGIDYDVAGPPWPAVNARTGRTEYLLADLYRSA